MFNNIEELADAINNRGKFHAELIDGDTAIRVTKSGSWRECPTCHQGQVQEGATLIVEKVHFSHDRQTVYCGNGATGDVAAWIESLHK